jgi:dephospho-CoA kinase
VSGWPGKYVIGLTGNIATGKSVVRRMLEHLGAYSIDADTLGHRAMAKGAPGHKPVLEAFGKFILGPDGEIDRSKLARIVFSDPEALRQLESIVHPLVEQAIDLMVQRAGQRVVVIEAIKLLEGPLAPRCDSIWVSVAPESLQKTRLMAKRGLSETDALQRIHAQPSQDIKTAAANVVIQNTGSFEETWTQVVAAWKRLLPAVDTPPVILHKAAKGEFSIQRGRPRDSEQIAALISRLSGRPKSADEIMAAFGERAYLLLMYNEKLVGLAGWQVENLVARTTEMVLDPNVNVTEALRILVSDLEEASQDLQCEASLLFVSAALAAQEGVWTELGYARRAPQTLGVQAWRDAAVESQLPDTILLFKQLRQDRILRPI